VTSGEMMLTWTPAGMVVQRESGTGVGAALNDEHGGGGPFDVRRCALGDDFSRRLVVVRLGHVLFLCECSGGVRRGHKRLKDSAVVLREKLLHGLPFRVVAVTNVDLKIMSRRTPTDSVLGRGRSLVDAGVVLSV
jgi:hypothetical protein